MRISIINNPYKSKNKRAGIRGVILHAAMELEIIHLVSEVRVIFHRRARNSSNGYYRGFYELYNKETKVLTIRVHKDDVAWLSWRLPHELYHGMQFITKELQIGPKEKYLTYKGKRRGRTNYKSAEFDKRFDESGRYPIEYINYHLPWETQACNIANKYHGMFGRI